MFRKSIPPTDVGRFDAPMTATEEGAKTSWSGDDSDVLVPRVYEMTLDPGAG
jgi:hypothetical protein